jgi:hypothetical protein
VPGKSRGTPRAGDLSGLVRFPTVEFSKKWLTRGAGPVDTKVGGACYIGEDEFGFYRGQYDWY